MSARDRPSVMSSSSAPPALAVSPRGVRNPRPLSLPYGFASSRPSSPSVGGPASADGTPRGGGGVTTPRGGGAYRYLNRLLEDSDYSFVYVRLVSASRLRAADWNGKSDPYACVRVGARLIYTTTLYGTLDPVWNEEAAFALENRHDFVSVRVWDEDVIGRDTLLGGVRIPVWEYEPDELHDLALPLESDAGGAAGGEVRLQFMYSVALEDVDVLLPQLEGRYEGLAAALVAPGLGVARYLVGLVGRRAEERDSDRFLRSLLTIFQNHTFSCTFELLEHFVAREVDRTEDPSTLFRSNSVATKLLSAYALSVGADHLRDILRPLVLNVCASSKTYEIDPNRLRAGESLSQNAENLVRKCRRVLDGILGARRPPRAMQEAAAMLRRVVGAKFDAPAVNGALAGFYFLRFLCPALVAPAHFSIVDEAPKTHSARFLLLITKTIQRLANRTASGDAAAAAAAAAAAPVAPAAGRVHKEAYMAAVEPFIAQNTPATAAFLNGLADARSGVKPAFENLDQRKFARALLFAHQFMHRRYGEVFEPVVGKEHDHAHEALREAGIDVATLAAFKEVVVSLGGPAPAPASASLRRNELLAERPSATEKHEQFMRRHSSLPGPHPQTHELAKPRGFFQRVKGRVRAKGGGAGGGGGGGGSSGMLSAEEERDELRLQLNDMFEAYTQLLHRQERDIQAEAARNERLKADHVRQEHYVQLLEGALAANDIPLPDLPPDETPYLRAQAPSGAATLVPAAADDGAAPPRPSSAQPRPRGLSPVPDLGEDALDGAEDDADVWIGSSSSGEEDDDEEEDGAERKEEVQGHKGAGTQAMPVPRRNRASSAASDGRHRANSVFMALKLENKALKRRAEKLKRRGDLLSERLRDMQRERDAMLEHAEWEAGARLSMASMPGVSPTAAAAAAGQGDDADERRDATGSASSFSAPGPQHRLS